MKYYAKVYSCCRWLTAVKLLSKTLPPSASIYNTLYKATKKFSFSLGKLKSIVPLSDLLEKSITNLVTSDPFLLCHSVYSRLCARVSV